MAVAFDAVGPAGGGGTTWGTSPGTWTHVNNGNGIFIGVTWFTGSSNIVTGVTYGGTTIPLLGAVASGGLALGGIAFYGLVGPTCPTGSNSVTVTTSDGTNNHNAGSISVSGAGSLGTPVTNAVTPNATGTITVNGTTTGGLLVSVACQGAGITISATAPNVLRFTHLSTPNSASDNIAGGTDPSTGGGANQTVTWTCGTADNWGLVAVEVLPPASAGPAPSPFGDQRLPSFPVVMPFNSGPVGMSHSR